MRLFFVSILLLIFLTGCPYKQVFTVIPDPVSNVNAFKIISTGFFYTVKNNIVKCDIDYNIKNETDNILELDFSASRLIGHDTTLKVSDIVFMGNVPVTDKVRIYPTLDTLIGLGFIGNKNNFGDTIKVILASPDLIYRTFSYKRIRKK